MALFQRHQLEQEGDTYTLVLYLDPSMTEFADDLGKNANGAQEKLENSVKNYVKEKFPNLKVKAAKVMLGSMMIASIPLGALTAQAEEAPATAPVPVKAEVTAAAQGQLPDVQGTKYESAVNMLTTIGVVAGKDDGKYHAGDNLSRAEFAKFAVYAAGYGPESERLTAPTTGFSDVSKDYWAAKYIKVAKDHGLMKGTGYNQFNPLGNITYEEIVTVLQRLQGYNDENLTGTWPSNHVSIATQSGITDDTDFTQGKASNRGDMAILLKNAILQPMVTYNAETNKFEPEDQTLFVKVFGDQFEIDKNGNVVSKVGAIDLASVGINEVTALTNGKVKINLNEAITRTPKIDNIAINEVNGKALAVSAAKVSTDGKSVVISTDAQTPYTLYTLTVGNYTRNFVGIPIDNTKPTATAVVTSNTEVKVTFNEEVDPETALNLANYQIDKGLTVTGAKLDSAGKVVTLTTSSQTPGTVYKLTIQNVTDLSGNAIVKFEPIFGGMAKDTTPPTASAVVTGNTTVEVTFNEKVDVATAQTLTNYAIDGLNITSASLDVDDQSDTYMRKVVLTTSEQTPGKIYKLTIQNVTDLAGNAITKTEPVFGGMAKDTIKPVAQAVVVSTNNKVTVAFNEKVDKATAENIANYSINNDLAVLRAQVDKTGKVITLTTSDQKPGTIYKITIQNVNDLAGNTMDRVDSYFGGMAKDIVPPTATVNSSTNKVTISYNEAVDPVSATNLANYVFDGGLGYPIRAEIDAANRVVTLTTGSQTPGKIYNVTINNVTDQSGNIISANTKKSFVGVGQTVAANINAEAIGTVNNNTIDLIFDKELSQTDVNSLVVNVNKEDGSTFTLPAGVTAHKLLQADKRIVRVQFGSVGTPNPDLFKAGKVYETTITGVPNLTTTNNANVKLFAGTNVVNEDPFVTTATALNNSALKVTFNEPVTNVTAGAFNISGGVTVSGISVSPGDVVTEAILYLNTSKTLTEGTIYDLTFNPGIRDAANLNGLKVTDYKVNFAGIAQTNVAPYIQAVVPVDKYTFKIIYSEPVNAGAANNYYALTKDGTSVPLTGASYSLSDDKTTVTVKMDSETPGSVLASGNIYELAYTGGNNVTDLQNLPYDTAARANKVMFGGVDTINPNPEIAAVDASGTTISVAFSEPIAGVTGGEGGTDFSALFTITVGGKTITPTGGSITADGTVINLTLDEADALEAGQTGTIKISTTGASIIKDTNKQAPKTDLVSFGTR